MFYRNKRSKQNMEIPQGGVVTPPSTPLIIIVIALIFIGMLAVFSSSAPKSIYVGEQPWYFLRNQFFYLVAGCCSLAFFVTYDYKKLVKWVVPLCLSVVVLLLLVKFTPLGTTVNGAKRWIDFGFFQLQPGEFAKIGMILCNAVLINKYNKKINQLWPLLIIGVFELIPFILVFSQPNLSTSIVLLVILVIQLFISKLNMKYIITAATVSLIVFVTAFVYIVNTPDQKIIKDYQRDRIMSLVNGGDSSADKYQTARAVQAIGSGGLYGKGINQGSISQLNYLPESHNDFVMAVVGEELGFVGILFVVAIFLAFIFRGLWVARGAPDDLARFIVIGYFGMIAMQCFVNMGVVTDFLPNTGIPIPFISYGGSSLWANLMGLGLVLNVEMHSEQNMF